MTSKIWSDDEWTKAVEAVVEGLQKTPIITRLPMLLLRLASTLVLNALHRAGFDIVKR